MKSGKIPGNILMFVKSLHFRILNGIVATLYHLSRIGKISLHKARALLDPADKQNVPKAVSLLQHLALDRPITRPSYLSHSDFHQISIVKNESHSSANSSHIFSIHLFLWSGISHSRESLTADRILIHLCTYFGLLVSETRDSVPDRCSIC